MMKKILLLLLLACLTSAVQAQSKYDLNTDNEVNVGDVTTLVNAILGKGGEGADLNGDNAVNVGDVTKLVNVILGKEPAEEEPAELQDAGNDLWTDGVLLYEVTDEEKAEVTVWSAADGYNLVSVNIPAEVKINAKVYTVTSIDEGAFDGDENLTSVTLPATIVSIGKNAFNCCTALKSIEIPNSVITIGDYAFAYCEGLTSLSLGSSVTSIGMQAFYYCTALTSLTIPNSVITIGDYAFAYCEGLTSLTIPASVTTIEVGAFIMCRGIESIVVEKENTTYDSRDNCHALIETASNKLIAGCKTTVIPATVEAIGDYAFSGHAGLKSITIPASVMSIGNYVFAYCSELENIVVEKENTTYDSRDNCHAIIETASNKLIAGCKTSVVPASVTSIGNYAFAYCTDLTSIDIPASVTSIGNYAFDGCTSLKSIVLPASLKSIGEWAFSFCESLESVTLPPFVEHIGERAFAYDQAIKDVTVQRTDPKRYGIEDNVFNQAYISSATLHVPAGCRKLYSYHVPWSDFGTRVEEAPAELEAYEDKWTDGNVLFSVVDEETAEVEVAGVEDKTSITAVNIPAKVTIGGKAYTVASIGSSAFSWCTNLVDVAMPLTLRSIGSNAFNKCSSLPSIYITDGIITIGNRAFLNCESLESVVITSSVESIGMYAFMNCTALKDVIATRVEPERYNCDANAFYNASISTATLHVPAFHKAIYQALSPWSDFGSIEEDL